jgi:hypothetical protein
MKWMRWSWRDLCDAPADLVDEIVVAMIREHEHDKR